MLTHRFWHFPPDNLPDYLKVSLELVANNFPASQYSVVFGGTNAGAGIPVLKFQALALISCVA